MKWVGICDHGYLDGRGCHDCDVPLLGAPVAWGLLMLLVWVLVVAFLLLPRLP